MEINYILHADVALRLHSQFGLEATDRGYIGILGHKSYSTVIEDENIRDYIWSLTAVPMSFTVVGEDRSIFDATRILQGYITSFTGQRCDMCETHYFSVFATIYPVINGDYLYASLEESSMFTINLSDFIGLTPVSYHPLAYDAIASLGTLFGVRVVGGITAFDSDMKLFVPVQDINDRIIEVEDAVNDMTSRGVIRLDKGSELRYRLITELTHVWKFKRDESPTDLVYMAEGSVLHGMIGCTFERWVENSIHRLMFDLPPLVQFTDDNIMRMEDRDRAILVFRYLCLVALRKSCAVNCKKSEDNLFVSPGLIAYVPVWGPSELVRFKENFNSSSVDEVYVHDIGDEDPYLVEVNNRRFSGIIIDNNLVSMSPILLNYDVGEDVTLTPLTELLGITETSDWEAYLLLNE